MKHDIQLRFYYQHVLSQVSGLDTNATPVEITHDVIQRFIQPLGLASDANILDLGCGTGVFLDRMRELGFVSVQGVTQDAENYRAVQARGHQARLGDPNFLPEVNESQDLLFCQRSLEHSVMPYITLLEYNRVLRPQAWLYVEVQDGDLGHNIDVGRGSFSVLPRSTWINLLYRTGFDIQWNQYEFQRQLPSGDTVPERRCIFLCRRRRSVDIK